MQGMNETITVWNKFFDSVTKKTVFYRHFVPNASWETNEIRAFAGNSVASIASVFDIMVENQTGYVPYAKWRNLSDEQKGVFFTFRGGDLCALGVHTIDIDGATVTEATIKVDLAPDICTIKAVSDECEAYKSAPHLELVGV